MRNVISGRCTLRSNERRNDGIYQSLYLSIALLAAAVFGNVPVGGQQGVPPEIDAYNNLLERGRALFGQAEFQAAAQSFAQALELLERLNLPQNSPLRYNTAAAYARCGKRDSAFIHLDILLRDVAFPYYEHMLQDNAFAGLYADERWQGIVQTAQRNLHKAAAIKERITFDAESREIVFYPPSAHVRAFITNDTLPLLSTNYENYRIYFRGNAYIAGRLDEFKRSLAVAHRRALTILDIPDYTRGVRIVTTESPEEMELLTGHHIQGGMAVAEHDLLILNYYNERRVQLKHELFHLISLNVWGPCRYRLLTEGSAVYADNECFYENPVYAINAFMLQEGKMYRLEDLIGSFNELARKSEVSAYLQSAGIFKYLYEKYGVAKMKRLWRKGFGAFADIYGQSIEAFEIEWRNFILTIPLLEEIDWTMLENEGCG